MNTSYAWMKAYVPGLNVSAQEFTDAMTLSGSKVEGYEALDADLDKIVVGCILSIERHPDADKLVICQVDIGQDQPVQIVTGASNITVNDKIPVVLDGGRVAGGHDGKKTPGGIKIKKESCAALNPMECSVRSKNWEAAVICIRKRRKTVSIFSRKMCRWERMR